MGCYLTGLQSHNNLEKKHSNECILIVLNKLNFESKDFPICKAIGLCAVLSYKCLEADAYFELKFVIFILRKIIEKELFFKQYRVWILHHLLMINIISVRYTFLCWQCTDTEKGSTILFSFVVNVVGFNLGGSPVVLIDHAYRHRSSKSVRKYRRKSVKGNR